MITIKDLKRVYNISINKDHGSESFFSVFIFRKISIIFSFFLATLRIHPNIISILAFISNISAGVLLMIDFHLYMYWAVFLIALGHILDMSDGEVSRLNDKGSKFGAFFDPFLDRVTDMILPLMIGLSYISNKNQLFLYALIFIYIGIRAGMLYLDQVSILTKVKKGTDTVRNSTSFLPENIRKYIKFDAGFAIVMYTAAIYTENIILLFIFLCAFYGLMASISFMKITKRLI